MFNGQGRAVFVISPGAGLLVRWGGCLLPQSPLLPTPPEPQAPSSSDQQPSSRTDHKYCPPLPVEHKPQSRPLWTVHKQEYTISCSIFPGCFKKLCMQKQCDVKYNLTFFLLSHPSLCSLTRSTPHPACRTMRIKFLAAAKKKLKYFVDLLSHCEACSRWTHNFW